MIELQHFVALSMFQLSLSDSVIFTRSSTCDTFSYKVAHSRDSREQRIYVSKNSWQYLVNRNKILSFSLNRFSPSGNKTLTEQLPRCLGVGRRCYTNFHMRSRSSSHVVRTLTGKRRASARHKFKLRRLCAGELWRLCQRHKPL